MAIIKRRLLIWLFKAYIQKWGKVIALSFLGGLVVFFLLFTTSSFLVKLFPVQKKVTVGIAGVYDLEQIPPQILQQVSRGLVKIEKDGRIVPDLASSWDISNDGKTYKFNLKKDVTFSNGKKLTSDLVTYSFSDAEVERPDEHTIVYHLRESYAPFLVNVSTPLFQKGFVGTGPYKIQDIKLNGNFIQSVHLVATRNKLDTQTYLFYHTDDALKVAFAMGEISQVQSLPNIAFKTTTFDTYKNVAVEKRTNSKQLVTLFYNTNDANLSDKKLRSALSYALPNEFAEGERTYVPYPKDSYYYNHSMLGREQDVTHAKELLDSVMEQASASAKPKVKITTLKKYRKTANEIAATWKQLDVQTEIEEVTKVPTTFQVYLGDFNVPKDPDQYMLWHSDQINNITKFRNLRIDKLLEDGRKTTVIEERYKIYADFQKYLLDEQPASFLYFPYEYYLTRK